MTIKPTYEDLELKVKTLEMQPKLLRVLQDGEFERLGSLEGLT